MNLKNGYKVLYEVVEDGNRVFKASTTGNPVDAEIVDTIANGTYKLVYQDADHKLRGSVSGVPSSNDPFLALNSVFFENVAESEATVEETEPEKEQPAAPQSEPEVVNPADEDEEEQIEE